MQIPPAARESELRKLFDELTEATRLDLMSHAMVLTHGNRGLAHDLYQEAWLAALRAFPAMPEQTAGAVFGYMRGAITKGFFTQLKNEGRLTGLDEALETGLEQQAPPVQLPVGDITSSLSPDLRQKLGALDPRLRRLMTLYAKGCSSAFIAELMGLAGEAEYRQLFRRAVSVLRHTETEGLVQPVTSVLPVLQLRTSSIPGAGRIYSATGMAMALGTDVEWVQRNLSGHEPVAFADGLLLGMLPRYDEAAFHDLRRRREDLDSVPYADELYAVRGRLAQMLDPPQWWDWVDANLTDMGAKPTRLRDGAGKICEFFLVEAVLPELQRRENESLLQWKTTGGMAVALGRSYMWAKTRLEPFASEGRVFGAFSGKGSNQKKMRYPPHVFEEIRRQHLAQKARQEDPYHKWR